MDKQKKYKIAYFVISIVLLLITPKILLQTEGVRMFAGKVLPIFEITLFVVLFVYYFKLFGKNSSFKNDRDMVLGKAKVESKKNVKEFLGSDGIVVGKNLRLSLKKSWEHVIVLGGTGSGKSTGFFFPNLLSMPKGVSAIVTDPKNELREGTEGYLNSIGKKCYTLSPFESHHKFFYNPLFMAKTKEEINTLSRIILSNGARSLAEDGKVDMEWINMSVPLFTACLCYVKEMNPYADISEAIDLLQFTDDEKLAEILEGNPVSKRYYAKFRMTGGSPKTASSIKTIIATNTQIFERDDIRDFIKTPVKIEDGKPVPDFNKLFDPFMLRNSEVAVFLNVPASKTAEAMPLMALIYSQIFEKLMEKEAGNGVFCFLDELGNLGKIDPLDTVATIGRSMKINLSLGVQDINQIKEIYGEAKKETILNNMKTKIAFKGLSGDSAQYISELSGDTTVKVESGCTSESGSVVKDVFGGSKSKNYSFQQRKLLDPNDVRTLEDGKLIAIFDNKNIIFDDKIAHYKDEPYKSRCKF